MSLESWQANLDAEVAELESHAEKSAATLRSLGTGFVQNLMAKLHDLESRLAALEGKPPA